MMWRAFTARLYCAENGAEAVKIMTAAAAGRGVIQIRYSTDIEYSPPPPRVCTSLK
jgi:hypothetical protein